MVRDFRELIFVSVLLKPLKQPGLHDVTLLWTLY